MSTSDIAGRARPLGNYSLVKRAGDFIHVSGTTARMPDGTIAGMTVAQDGTRVPDAAEQTRVIIANIGKALASCGAQLTDCVDITVYLTDMNDFDKYNKAYGEYFDANGPSRTTIGVKALPHKDMVVEIKAIAYLPR